uniref:Uncharacterized protein n=2 Tax=Lygus hesperus TaxID=30085 RepID=A0A146KNW6_LYGHE
MNVYNSIFAILKLAPDSTILCTYPVPFGRLPYRLFEALNYTGYKTAYNAAFYADYSIRNLKPFSYSQFVEGCVNRMRREVRVRVAEMQLMTRTLQEYEYLLRILQLQVDTAKLTPEQRDGLDSLRSKINNLQRTLHTKYQHFIGKYDRELVFSPHIPESLAHSAVDDPEYVLTLGHLQPKDSWDGVGIMVFNGPQYIDKVFKVLGETLQLICELPSGYAHKRVGSIHEPVGGPKEYDTSYKYQDFRRTCATFNPYHRTLLPDQLTAVLLKEWKRKAAPLLHDVPLYSGPESLQGAINELMQDGPTEHAVQLFDTVDPYTQMKSRQITKLLHDPLFDSGIRREIREMRLKNDTLAHSIVTNPHLLNNIDKLLRVNL